MQKNVTQSLHFDAVFAFGNKLIEVAEGERV